MKKKTKKVVPSKFDWQEYHTKGIIKSDRVLKAMIVELAQSMRSMDKIYGAQKMNLITRGMLLDFRVLSDYAFHRGINVDVKPYNAD